MNIVRMRVIFIFWRGERNNNNKKLNVPVHQDV